MSETSFNMSMIKKDLILRKKSSNVYYILLLLLIVSFFVLTLEGGSGIQKSIGRALGFLLLIVIGFDLIQLTMSSTEKPDFWKEKKELDETINLRMQDTSVLLQRASEGKKISQKMFLEKVRKIFIMKLKEKKDLSEKDVRYLLRNPDEFRSMVQDDMISDFMLSNDHGREQKKGLERFLRPGSKDEESKKDYEKKVKEIIRRIEEWN